VRFARRVVRDHVAPAPLEQRARCCGGDLGRWIAEPRGERGIDAPVGRVE
jgi:hypothetical protein